MIDKLQWSHNLHLGEGNYESDLLSAMGWRQQWLPVRAGAAVVQDSSNILPGPLWQLGCWYRDLPIDGWCAKQVSVAAFKQLTPLLIGRDTQTTITSTHTHTHIYTHSSHHFYSTFGMVIFGNNPTGTSPNGCMQCSGMKKSQFSTNVTLYIENETIESHS